MKITRLQVLLVMLVATACLIPFRDRVRSVATSAGEILKGRKTVEDRLKEFGDVVRQRLATDFKKIEVVYPPKRIALVGLKQERFLEVWVSDDDTHLRLLKTYPIRGTSGTIGPKLMEGDGQVPEGIYGIESLNPNSRHHLALRVNYPNSFDRAKGMSDGRTNPGSDIMIHGSDVSIGCLAMGDEAAEDLFVLVAMAGVTNVHVILSPVDFRKRSLPANIPSPPWTLELYADIREELAKFRLDATTLGPAP